jgi:hypothetical protein
MTYQDIWAHGKLVELGQRECESRYAIVKFFCHMNFRHLDHFTVCDIGANMNYFGIRLTEDFQQCHVMSFEFHQFNMREAHLKHSGTDRVMFIERKLSLNDINNLSAFCTFDLVLAMSVFHHLKTGERDHWLPALRNLGRYVIAEFAMQDSVRARSTLGSIPDDAIPLGTGLSHLDKTVKRPIVLMKGKGSPQ